MKRFLWIFILMIGATSLIGCGQIETEIVRVAYLKNTDDSKGPYQVLAVIQSDLQPLTVTVEYTTDNWKTRKSVAMTQSDESLFVGHIPGQKAGTTIRYFISVQDSSEKKITDPLSVPPSPEKDSTYRFQVVQ